MEIEKEKLERLTMKIQLRAFSVLTALKQLKYNTNFKTLKIETVACISFLFFVPSSVDSINLSI